MEVAKYNHLVNPYSKKGQFAPRWGIGRAPRQIGRGENNKYAYWCVYEGITASKRLENRKGMTSWPVPPRKSGKMPRETSLVPAWGMLSVVRGHSKCGSLGYDTASRSATTAHGVAGMRMESQSLSFRSATGFVERACAPREAVVWNV